MLDAVVEASVYCLEVCTGILAQGHTILVFDMLHKSLSCTHLHWAEGADRVPIARVGYINRAINLHEMRISSSSGSKRMAKL
jgi:hypothetical protein